MKKVFILFSLVLFVSCAVKTPYDAFTKENKQNINFSVGLSNFLVRNFVMDKESRIATKNLGIQKYRLVVSKQSSEIFETKLRAFLSKNNFEELVRVSKNGQKVNIYSYQINQSVKEVIVKVNNGNEMFIISAKGKNILTSNLDSLVSLISTEN